MANKKLQEKGKKVIKGKTMDEAEMPMKPMMKKPAMAKMMGSASNKLGFKK